MTPINPEPDYFFVVIKRGKYLEGHRYSTAFGRKYRWTKDLANARKFDPLHSDADYFASQTNGKIIKQPKSKSNDTNR